MCEDFIAENLAEVRAMDSAYERLDASSLSHLLDKANANAFVSREAERTGELPQQIEQRGMLSQAKRIRTDTETQICTDKEKALDVLKSKGAKEHAPTEELTPDELRGFAGARTLVKEFDKDVTRVESKEPEAEAGVRSVARHA